MPSFVATLFDAISSTTITFLTAVIENYWLTILGVGFIIFIIGLFWRLAHSGHGGR